MARRSKAKKKGGSIQAVKKRIKKGKTKVKRLVAIHNIERMEAKGYEVISDVVADKRGRILGVKTHATDLVLMEKEI